LKVSPVPSFRNPPGVDIRNPEKAVDLWMPDHGFAASGMAVIDIFVSLKETTGH